MKTNPTYSELFDLAWKSINKKLPLVAGLTFVYFLGLGALSIVPILGSFLAVLLTPGYLICLLQLRDDKEFGFSEFFWGMSDFQRVIQLSILYFLKTLLIIAGFIIFIVPGFYLAIAFSFSEISFISKEQDGIYALKHSLKLAKGRWWYLVGLILLICLTNLVGMLMFGIGLLLTLPLSFFVLLQYFLMLDSEESASLAVES